jgi:hypothetical protein
MIFLTQLPVGHSIQATHEYQKAMASALFFVLPLNFRIFFNNENVVALKHHEF